MIDNSLRRFCAEIFGGLPIGAALVAAAVVGLVCLIPSVNPSGGEQSGVSARSVIQRIEDRLVVKLERNESMGGLLTRHGLRALSARELLLKMR